MSTDFRTLGRVGVGGGPRTGGSARRRWSLRGRTVRRAGAGVPHVARRPVLPRSLTVGAAVAVVGLIWVGATAGSQMRPASTATQPAVISPSLEAELMLGGVTQEDPGARLLIPGQSEPATEAARTARAFAAIDDLALLLPHPDVEMAVFREGDSIDALPLAPVGRLVANGNPEGFAPPRTLDGPEYAVLPPDEGIRPATGAVDVLVPPDAEVLAPVSGRVAQVASYPLPAGGVDWRIVIHPAHRPDLQVSVRNLAAPVVAVGDEVEGGTSIIGMVHDRAVVDAELNPGGHPSVRLAVRPAVDDGVYDPHAPAVLGD